MLLCSAEQFFSSLFFPDSLFASQEGENRGETADQTAKVWQKKINSKEQDLTITSVR